MVRFIGLLFLRQLLTARIIGEVLRDLARRHDAETVPSECELECICELLMTIGRTLEGFPVGRDAIQQMCDQLADLQGRRGEAGRPVYPFRVHCLVQDVLDARAAGWRRRSFRRPAPRTKAEVRREAYYE